MLTILFEIESSVFYLPEFRYHTKLILFFSSSFYPNENLGWNRFKIFLAFIRSTFFQGEILNKMPIRHLIFYD